MRSNGDDFDEEVAKEINHLFRGKT